MYGSDDAFCDYFQRFGYPSGVDPYSGQSSTTGTGSTSSNDSESDTMTRDVTHITIWKDDDSPAYHLKNGAFELTDDCAKVLVPRERTDQYESCSSFPNNYEILISDLSGDDPDGVIYDGTIDVSLIKAQGNKPHILFKCLPAELAD